MPLLKFHNIYVLRQGYCNFVDKFPALCTQNGGYTKMTDRRFTSEMSKCFEKRKEYKVLYDKANVSEKNTSDDSGKETSFSSSYFSDMKNQLTT